MPELLVVLSKIVRGLLCFSFFFFNDPAPTEIYTLSLHDALPICGLAVRARNHHDAFGQPGHRPREVARAMADRKSTRLNSSHMSISYAVFCLKKKKKNTSRHIHTNLNHPSVFRSRD